MGVTIYRIHVDAKKNLYQKNFHEEDCFYPQKQIEAFLWKIHFPFKSIFLQQVFFFTHKYNINDVFSTDIVFFYPKNKNGYDKVVSITEIWYTYLSN